MLPELPPITTVHDVEKTYHKISENYPQWGEQQIMRRLGEVVEEGLFLVWWNNVYIKRWQNE